MTSFTDEEFVGYTFRGLPERRPRLWFLDRHLYPLIVWGNQILLEGDDSEFADRVRFGGGATEAELRAHAEETGAIVGQWSVNLGDREGINFPTSDPWEVIQMAMPGVSLRFESWGLDEWSAVWKLTDLTIPHVHTFGMSDTWRLGIWPD